MPLIAIVVTLIVVGVLLWLANQYIPMDAKIKLIMNIAVVVVVIIWLMHVMNIWHYLTDVRVQNRSASEAACLEQRHTAS